jgi:hypothetical protein
MTTSLFVLSTSSILSSLSSHCEFILGMEKLGARYKNFTEICYPLEIALSPKLRNLKLHILEFSLLTQKKQGRPRSLPNFTHVILYWRNHRNSRCGRWPPEYEWKRRNTHIQRTLYLVFSNVSLPCFIAADLLHFSEALLLSYKHGMH